MDTTPRTCTSWARRGTRSTAADSRPGIEGTVRQRGGALVEFSFSVVVLWLLVAATLELGRAYAASHVLQSAARSAARELAFAEIAWDADFEAALDTIYDPDYLVVDADCLDRQAAIRGTSPGAVLAEILDGLSLNVMLRPLMVFDRVAVDGSRRNLLRYPGALLRADDSGLEQGKLCATDYTVGIPEVDATQSEIRFHGVVEELEDGAFALSGGGGAVPAGTVALRLRYPFQAVGLSGWRLVDGFSKPVLASESEGYAMDTGTLEALDASTIDALDARRDDGELQAYALTDRGDAIPVYGGSLGLGFQALHGKDVRPYRRVLLAQAIAPREVIATGAAP